MKSALLLITTWCLLLAACTPSANNLSSGPASIGHSNQSQPTANAPELPRTATVWIHVDGMTKVQGIT
ncbi:MAG: hypothetical protein KF696_14905 [Planctomycetes bacterium]|nr:hypothetical protein [Planctomycetota bacterium]MCW8135856.1 hypothetical protein [Planctomycetota bacterium]